MYEELVKALKEHHCDKTDEDSWEFCTECYCGTRPATHKHFSMKEWKEVGDTVEFLAKIWNRRAENERQNFF